MLVAQSSLENCFIIHEETQLNLEPGSCNTLKTSLSLYFALSVARSSLWMEGAGWVQNTEIP